MQDGSGTFPWCVKVGSSLADGFVEVKFKHIDAPVSAGMWHTLRVEFHGAHITVSLDGKRYIEVHDDHITGAGAVGVWTKADSVTAFDEFNAGPVGR